MERDGRERVRLNGPSGNDNAGPEARIETAVMTARPADRAADRARAVRGCRQRQRAGGRDRRTIGENPDDPSRRILSPLLVGAVTSNPAVVDLPN